MHGVIRESGRFALGNQPRGNGLRGSFGVRMLVVSRFLLRDTLWMVKMRIMSLMRGWEANERGVTHLDAPE